MTAAAFTASPPRAEPTLAVCVGRILAVSGLCFGGANLFQWAVLSGTLPVHPMALAFTWPIAVGVFLTTLFRIRSRSGEAGRIAAGWSRTGIMVSLATVLALVVVSASQNDWSRMQMASGVSLTVYGMAWLIAAARTGRWMMGVVSLTAFVGVAAVYFNLGTPDQYFAAAVTLMLVALLPGVTLAAGGRI
jgi:hypothetical protein